MTCVQQNQTGRKHTMWVGTAALQAAAAAAAEKENLETRYYKGAIHWVDFSVYQLFLSMFRL